MNQVRAAAFPSPYPFSLSANLIRPILAEQKEPGNLIALFAAQIEPRDGSPDVPSQVLDAARSILQQSLRADTAILLPSMGPVDEHKLFFVVANLQQRSAEVIDKRILNQLGGDREFQSDNFTVSVSHVFLPPMSRETNESMGTLAERAAAEVREQINTAVCL